MRKNIYFWLPQGRLGNLIFQYQAAKYFAINDGLLISIESEFSDIFLVDEFVKFIKTPKPLRKYFKFLWVKILTWFIKMGFFGVITPKQKQVLNFNIESTEIEKSTGFFSRCFVLQGFFQHDHFIDSNPKIKANFLKKAENLLNHIPYQKRVAVHLRFGDYSKWKVFGKEGVSLPIGFYKRAFSLIFSKISDPVFVVFTDDKRQAQKYIGVGSNFFFFCDDSLGVEFAGISLCEHAIISASTFAWWGAYLIENPNRIIVAPKYWAGFKSERWYPDAIFTKNFKYIQADEFNSDV